MCQHKAYPLKQLLIVDVVGCLHGPWQINIPEQFKFESS